MATAAILDLTMGGIWPQAQCVRLNFYLQFEFRVVIYWFDWDMSFYSFCEFGWETLDHAHFLAVLGGYWHPKVKFNQPDPEKALP